jgi:MFS family permease
MIFPLLPVFLSSLGAAPAFLGLVEGLADAVSSFLKLASGYAADRTQRNKPMVLIGYSIASLARPLVALAGAPWHVLVVRVVDRVGKGIRTSPRDVMIANAAASAESGRAFGFHRAMDHAGAVVGPLIATALLGLGVSMRDVFWLALVPGLASIVIVALVREPDALAGVPRMAASVAPGTPKARLPGSVRGYFAILALFSLGASSDAFLLLRAHELGVPTTALPLLWAVFHIAKLVSSYFGGDISDRMPRVKLIVAGWMVYAATYLAFGLATEAWHAWALFPIYGCYYGLTEPTEKALVKDLTPQPLRGRAFGYFNFISGIVAVPAGLLTGFLWQTWSAQVALGTGAAIAAVASVALIVWASGKSEERLSPDEDLF